MTEPQLRSLISDDRHLTDPDDDKLGFAPFARHLATALSSTVLSEGLVIAINGPWGSGKSTVISFIEHYLSERSLDLQPITVYFNPWWFSGQEDLTRRFFAQIAATISKRAGAGNQILEAFTEFAEVVSHLPPAVEALTSVLPWMPSVKAGLEALKPQVKDVDDLRSRLEKELLKLHRPIVVFVDDIDRLAVEEVRQIFRLVKSVGSFPNITYVLAFDTSVVVKALDGLHGGTGAQYLEKIIQVPFDLPPPDPHQLSSLLRSKLDILLSDCSQDDFDKERWARLYVNGLRHFIHTPRDVVRLINSLAVAYPAIKGEVNVVDLIGIEALRIFRPSIYHVIRRSSDHFTGVAPWGYSYAEQERKDSAAFHENWLNTLEEHDTEALKRFLTELFPKLASVWSNTFYGNESLRDWRRSNRICSPELFSTYFHLSLPDGRISNAEMSHIMNRSSDQTAFMYMLRGMIASRCAGGSRIRVFLDRLLDYTDEGMCKENYPSILAALFALGDEIIVADPEKMSGLEFGNDLYLENIIIRALHHYDEEKRFLLLMQLMQNGEAPGLIVAIVSRLERHEEKLTSNREASSAESMLTAEHLVEIRKAAADRICLLPDGILLNAPYLRSVLFKWEQWLGLDTPRNWVSRQVETDEGLLILLERLLAQGSSHAFSDVLAKHYWRLDPEWLQPYVNTDEIAVRLQSIENQEQLPARQSAAIK